LWELRRHKARHQLRSDDSFLHARITAHGVIGRSCCHRFDAARFSRRVDRLTYVGDLGHVVNLALRWKAG
jgi:hypothetical protein